MLSPSLSLSLLSRTQKRVASNASKFMLAQWGVCFFWWDGDGKLVAEPYNFEVFPAAGQIDRRFLCQASSIQFLAGAENRGRREKRAERERERAGRERERERVYVCVCVCVVCSL